MSQTYNITQVGSSAYVTAPDGSIYVGAGPSNSNCTLAFCPVELSIYGYRPSLPGSITVISLYAICMVIQVALGVRYKTWGFMVSMLLGCISEIVGYIGRVMYWQNPWTNAGFIIQVVTITFAPVFFAAAVYVMIYKIINFIDPSLSRVKPMFMYAFFIAADMVSLILQAAGGAMSATSNGSSSAGVYIALAGMALQVATLTLFCVIVIEYLVRARPVIVKHGGLGGKFKVFAGFLTLALVTLFTRCCYRVYELSEGYSQNSAALRNEPLFTGLEMSMIVIAAYALIGAHPGPVFNRGVAGPAHTRSETQKEARNLASESE